MSRYGTEYYQYQSSGSYTSASKVVPLIAARLQPSSVIDFGCGVGPWLQAWADAGVKDLCGLDGRHVTSEQFLLPFATCFTPVDLTQPVRMNRRFSFAQCLEVAEHLPETCADDLVDSITAAAPIVVFGAAVPGQGGKHHINEQPLEYWRRRFAARNYDCFDWIRPQIRDVPGIEPWYRFNPLLYVHRDAVSALPSDIRQNLVPSSSRLVEGGNFRWRVRRSVVSRLPRSVVDAIAAGLERLSTIGTSQRLLGLDSAFRTRR